MKQNFKPKYPFLLIHSPSFERNVHISTFHPAPPENIIMTDCFYTFLCSPM